SAQFEREVIGERIRDKFRASRSRGMWMGGHPPLGYDVKDRKNTVNEAEAATVRKIFEEFAQVGSATTLARQLAAEGILTKRGRSIDRGYLYILLNNRTYIGEAVHRGKVIKRGPEACTIRRVAAAEIEATVIDQIRALVRTPEIIVRTWK